MQCRARVVELVQGDVCAHEYFQCRDTLGAIVRLERAEVPLRELRGAGMVSAVERDRRATDEGQWMSTRSIKQRLRLVQPTLPPTEFAQSSECLGNHAGAARLQLVGGADQLRFGLGPCALPDAGGGVLRAADREEHAEVPALAELAQARTPLRRAVVFAHAIAGGNQVAAGQADRHVVLHLARDHGCVHRVQLLHALRNLS